MANIRALVVNPDGSVQDMEVENDFRAFQSVVGGYIEAVSGREATIYVDEEGLYKGCLPNPLASRFAQQVLGAGVYLLGTALILGPSDTEGNDTPVRPSTVDYFKEN